ncbi:MAG: hypothetical protein ACK45J_05655 [Acidimicrobiaceae bacterium]|jgi:hypothetical protein|nr:hypothetical protein [Ilumatobacteraceae bacterium]
MRFNRLVATAIAGTFLITACGTGSESSDTTERTRNTAISSPFANMVMFVSGETTGGETKIYQYTFNTAGVPVVTEIYSAPVGGNVGVTGISYETASNTLYWAMQEGSDLKIKSVIPGAGDSPTTLYTVPGGYPYSLATNGTDSIVFSGQTTSPQVWVGSKSGSAASSIRSAAAGSVVMASGVPDLAYGIEGSILTRYIWGSRPSTRVVANPGTTLGWPTLVDQDASTSFYVTDFVSGSNQVYSDIHFTTDEPVLKATASKRIMAMAMKSDGSLFFADGPRPSRGDALTPSTITWVSATDSSDTQEITADPALAITSMWIVEPPTTAIDSVLEGDGLINTEHYCSHFWNDSRPGLHLGRESSAQENQWYVNGLAVPGATSDSYTPTEPGRVKCVGSGSNVAGTSSVSSPEINVIDPTATTMEPSGSGSGSTPTTVGATPTPGGSTPSTPTAPQYKSIAVKWTYSASRKTITGTFRKVTGARTYGMSISGATKKTVRCRTSGTSVVCTTALKKGKNNITITARNAAKVIVAQRLATKTVK